MFINILLRAFIAITKREYWSIFLFLQCDSDTLALIIFDVSKIMP